MTLFLSPLAAAAQLVGRHKIGHHENEKRAPERRAEFDPCQNDFDEYLPVSDIYKPQPVRVQNDKVYKDRNRDKNSCYDNPQDILRSNIINLVGLLRIMFSGLTPEEDAIIDSAITQTYASRDITPNSDFSKATIPTMSDLKTILDSMAGAESLSRRLEKYVSGSYAGFLNNPTNLEIKNKLVVFSIRDMEEEYALRRRR